MSESQLNEYKESWRDEYLKWLCGFANAQGGVLYIGIDDKGSAVGISDSKKLLEDIPNTHSKQVRTNVRDTMGIVAEVNLIEKSGKDVLEIKVEPSQFPVNYKGEYHYRSGSTKQQLKGNSPNSFIKIGYFDGSDVLYQDEVKGSLFEQAEKCIDYER